jgi:hypothetical protein
MPKEVTTDSLSALPWNSQFYSVPSEVKQIPTMLTDEEGRMLRWIAEFDYTGIGAICELGSFIGGSTARLAFGLSKNKQTRSKIHAFDRFECAEGMKPDLLYKKGIAPFAGVDILPTAKQLLATFRGLIEFHKGDLNKTQWAGGPIELLFVDIAKSAATADHVARQFYKDLIPGRSVVIHQDYFHHQNPWIVVQMEALAEKFSLVAYAQNNSAVFRLKDPLSADDLASCSWFTLEARERVDLIVRAISRFPHLRQQEMLARSAFTVSQAPEVSKASEYPRRNVSQRDLVPWITLARETGPQKFSGKL